MTKRAIFQITVGGINVTENFRPYLISLRISDKVGTHSDTANITLDDRNGQLLLPSTGDPVLISLGWQGEGFRPVFSGTVDKVQSNGGEGGMILTISAKGMDTKRKPKQPQQRHIDDTTIKGALEVVGLAAGITSVEVDDALADIKIEYLDLRDESFIHFGERLAREYGGNFRINGSVAQMSARDGQYTALAAGQVGVNLHSWSIEPLIGRMQYSKALGRWYDRLEATWKSHVEEIDHPDADAQHAARYPLANEDVAKGRTGSDKATSERDSGGGSVVIEGTTEAIPDGLFQVLGARPGIDGLYRIESVEHSLNPSGWTTSVELKHPQGDAGQDTRTG